MKAFIEDIVREIPREMIHMASQVIINKDDNVTVFKNKYGKNTINSCRLTPENTVIITLPLHEYERRIEERKREAERQARGDYPPF